MNTLTISGYENDADGSIKCEHCGRMLKHGIRLSDGRLVGATCLDKKLTKARVSQSGKLYRAGSELIIKAAKCVQFVPENRWLSYGINKQILNFEAA